MRIVKTQYDDFCFGVSNAMKKAEEALAKYGGIYTLGDIINNAVVVKELEAKGAHVIKDLDDAPDGSVVLIRSHGVGRSVYERAKLRNITLVDATCPRVTAIHKRAERYSKDGWTVAIVGSPSHPEVAGTAGWCAGRCELISGVQAALEMPRAKKLCVVSQTTITDALFKETSEALKSRADEIEIFNCICETTINRQLEAAQIAAVCDAVVVIGGRNSSNTQNLASICKEHCKNVISIETADEYTLEKVGACVIIGVVVGASTPNRLIMEVITRMNELEMNVNAAGENADVIKAAELVAAQTAGAAANKPEAADDASHEESFSEAFEKTLVRIRNGQVLKGTVVQIVDEEVCVNIGYKSDGFIPRSEFSSDSDVVPSEVVHVGDEIEVEVLKVNDGEGNVLLSRKNVESKLAWDRFVDKFKNGDNLFEIIPKEVVKGGIIGFIDGVRTFVPASQVAIRYVENLNDFVGKPMNVKILEVDEVKKRVVASAKALLIEEAAAKKKAIWENIEKDTVVHGIVRRLTDFGAFVDIGGVDGLVHVTELAWGRVKHPSDVLAIGQEIDVMILDVNPEKERISLGYKQLQPKPWTTAAERYQVGSIVEGKVVRIVPFGAFVALEPTIDGLVHISQVATKRINKVEDELKIGDIIRCKVLDVNPEAKRISLSRREVLLEEQPPIEDIIEDAVEAPAEPSEEKVSVPPVESASTSLADLFANIDLKVED